MGSWVLSPAQRRRRAGRGCTDWASFHPLVLGAEWLLFVLEVGEQQFELGDGGVDLRAFKAQKSAPSCESGTPTRASKTEEGLRSSVSRGPKQSWGLGLPGLASGEPLGPHPARQVDPGPRHWQMRGSCRRPLEPANCSPAGSPQGSNPHRLCVPPPQPPPETAEAPARSRTKGQEHA